MCIRDRHGTLRRNAGHRTIIPELLSIRHRCSAVSYTHLDVYKRQITYRECSLLTQLALQAAEVSMWATNRKRLRFLYWPGQVAHVHYLTNTVTAIVHFILTVYDFNSSNGKVNVKFKN